MRSPLCKFFGAGKCRKGDTCWFIHPTDAFLRHREELSNTRDRDFKKVCHRSLFGNCRNQLCRNIHASDDTRYAATEVEAVRLRLELAESISTTEALRAEARQREESRLQTVRYAARLRERLDTATAVAVGSRKRVRDEVVVADNRGDKTTRSGRCF